MIIYKVAFVKPGEMGIWWIIGYRRGIGCITVTGEWVYWTGRGQIKLV